MAQKVILFFIFIYFLFIFFLFLKFCFYFLFDLHMSENINKKELDKTLK